MRRLVSLFFCHQGNSEKRKVKNGRRKLYSESSGFFITPPEKEYWQNLLSAFLHPLLAHFTGARQLRIEHQTFSIRYPLAKNIYSDFCNVLKDFT
jgi:hypothetical protein